MCTMDQQRFCDYGPCPSTHPEQEVLMHCPQLQLEPGQQDTLACEFDDGSRVNAAWDDEGQTASYLLPKVMLDAMRLSPERSYDSQQHFCFQ